MDSPGEHELSQIIENSLAAILSGETSLDVILARYPEHSQLIQSEIGAALWLVSRRDELSMRAGFVPASRKRLVGRIQAEAKASRRSGKRASLGLLWPRRLTLQFAAALTIFMLLFLSSFGAVSASQSTVPGDTLYGVKRLSEDVRYTFTLDPIMRANLSLQFSNRRLSEIEVLIARGEYEQVAAALSDFEYKVNQSVELMQDLQEDANPPDATIVAEIQAQLERQTQQLAYLLSVAPESAQSGLLRAIEVSKHGAEKADEMHEKINPQGPNKTISPVVVKTLAPADLDGQSKTKVSPPGKVPSGVDMTKTPRPAIEKRATHTEKAPQDSKESKPTKEESDKESPPGNSPPDDSTPPGQSEPPGQSNPPGLDNPADDASSKDGKEEKP